jgi:hypothetical protein
VAVASCDSWAVFFGCVSLTIDVVCEVEGVFEVVSAGQTFETVVRNVGAVMMRNLAERGECFASLRTAVFGAVRAVAVTCGFLVVLSGCQAAESLQAGRTSVMSEHQVGVTFVGVLEPHGAHATKEVFLAGCRRAVYRELLCRA